MRTLTKTDTCIQDPASLNFHQHSVQDTLSKQQRQKYKPNHQLTRLPPHTDMPIREGKELKTSPYPMGTQTQVTPYIKLKQITD